MSFPIKKKEKIILFREHKKPSGKTLLEIFLNRPKKLNVLNLHIMLALNKKIREWRDREDLSAVFIHSAGDRAFCAGGDVVQIRSVILKSRAKGEDPALSSQVFFQTEYETGFMLSQLPCPVVVWGTGIVMGGGMGLFMASSHPIVTPTSVLAMPEVLIGFFPDVGCSWFLNKIPGRAGRYLALTAGRLNGFEALSFNLARWAFPESDRQKVLNFMIKTPFSGPADFTQRFKKYFPQNRALLKKQSHRLKALQKEIEKSASYEDFMSFFEGMSARAPTENETAAQNRKNFLKAPPFSLAVTFEQFKRARGLSLKAVFEMELALALQISQRHDFSEGVRALLVDKSKDPMWKPARAQDIKPLEVEACFKPLKSWNAGLRV